MVNSADFAKRLQKILDYYGISATAFSEEIEVNRSTISHLLSGRNKPSLDFVMKVIQHYPEVGLYWLLNGKGSFPAETPEPQIPVTPIPEETAFQSQVNPSEEKLQQKTSSQEHTGEIDRIVIFYKDGSFKAYKN